MEIWFARVIWFALPLTAGVALSDALDAWSSEPAIVAQVLAWSAWTVASFVLLAPRPWGFTILRVLAPAPLVIAITCAWSTGPGVAALAIAAAAAAAVAALGAPVAGAAANALAYGDEERFPLRAPVALLLGPVPLAALVVSAAVTVPSLLLAVGNPIGLLVLATATPTAVLALRALHGLGRRAIVLVPAGLVVIDAMSLAEPVLVPRERITGLARSDVLRPPPDALDLRLGTALGTVELLLREPVTFFHRRARRAGELVSPARVLFAPLRPGALLAAAARRRVVSS